MNVEREFDAARKRLNEYITRAVGQKLRRLREADQRSRSLTQTGAASVVGCGSGTTNQRGKADSDATEANGLIQEHRRSEYRPKQEK